MINYAALLWQKEASDKCDISCKRAKCVHHFHWRQWNIMMSYLTYLLAGWVFMHKIWPGRRAHWVKYRNINNSDLDGMSLASFCQSRAVWRWRVSSENGLYPFSSSWDIWDLKGKFSSGIEGTLASTLNHDFNWKQLSEMILCIFLLMFSKFIWVMFPPISFLLSFLILCS